MTDEKLKEKFPNIKTEEELEEIKKYLFKVRFGTGFMTVAGIMLLTYFFASWEAGLYLAIIIAILGSFFFYSSEGHKRLMYKVKEVPGEQQVLNKAVIIAEADGDYTAGKKLATWGIISWTLFVIGIEIFAKLSYGEDYIAQNWLIPVILLGIGWGIGILWIFVPKTIAKKAHSSMENDDIVILQSAVKSHYSAGKGNTIKMLSFESETYGKHEQKVDDSEYYTARVGVDIYYLVLRKTKKKYRLIKAYSAKKWKLDTELTKYLVKEVI